MLYMDLTALKGENTSFGFLITPFLLLLVLPLFFLIVKQYLFLKSPPSSSPKRPPLPPGPKPWPIFGNILQLGRKPHITMAQFAKTHGPLISLRLGTQLVVIGSTPAAAMEILKTHDRLLSARHVLRLVQAEGVDLSQMSLIWAPCNEQWKLLRSLCKAELFSTKAIESQAILRQRKMVEMIEFLGSREGRTVKIKQVVSNVVFNTLTNLFFSRDFISFEDGETNNNGLMRILEKLMELGTRPSLGDFYPILDSFDLQGTYKKCVIYIKQVYTQWEHLIKERRESRQYYKERDFLDAMIKNHFTDDQINRLIIELLTAGVDTTTSIVEWAMTELLKNKEAMERVVEELSREFKDRNSISESLISQLPYLNACLKETLRLHAPIPLLLPHSAPETCEVMNYTIPKNTQVFVNVWAMGRDPAIWEEPLLFKPERFMVSMGSTSNFDFKGHDFGFLPFGSGRRICPGLTMGTRQALVVLANLIRCFDWSLPNNQDPADLDVTEKLGIILHKEQPLLLIPKPKL